DMKKLLFAAAAALAITSCTSDLSDLNVNGKAPESVPSGALFANAVMGYYDFDAVQNVNLNNLRLWSQHWTQTTYVDESNFNLNERDVNGSTFVRMYVTVIRDCEEARTAVMNGPESAAAKAASVAAIEVMEVMAYQYLVDLFGDVPYSEALSETNVPKYDAGSAIYADLLARLDAATADLSGSNTFGSSDIIYGGDAAAWKKAANSLMLRMAVRMIGYDAAAAKSWGEKAIAGGVFMSSADDMRLYYSSAPPHTHPMWETLVQSGRTDYVASATLGDVLNGLADPRRAGFFKNLGGSDSVTGAPHGFQVNYYDYSQPGTALEDPTWSHAAISYVEVEFLMAHAAVAGWAGASDAATHYENGIRASIEEWGGSSADADAYMMHPLVAFSSTTAATQIGVQKWIAMYSNAFEAYAAVRMYDLPMQTAALAGTVTPTRYSYPLDEYSLNTTNVQAAAANYGGDDTFAKVFWDM
ncbi:MAG: SusD/RagB family nutrient-binding outer membrane lipoprotein, partial [Schleiferiaceae bacterium]